MIEQDGDEHRRSNGDDVVTEHDKIEHVLPNGDILVIDSTRIAPEVDAAFRQVEDEAARRAQEMYRELRKATDA